MTSCLNCGHQDPGEFIFCPRCGMRAPGEAGGKDPLLGRTLNGKYRIESEIGSGAMGTVYLGEHVGLKKKVALKILRSDLEVSEESLQRFQREGIAAGKFNHPHAIQIFDFDKGEGRIFYLAMEYVDGPTLTAFLARRGALPVAVALRLAGQILSCLAEAHRHGIVHRDLKPDNIMVVEDVRGDVRVKVLDFGLSKLVDRRLESSLVTQPGRLLGTPLYMSPEQVAGEEADERSDVYAAGLMLYEMVAGERPFGEQSATQLFMSRPAQEAPSIGADRPDLDVPPELDQVVSRALQRDRRERFQSAEEMLAALDEVPLAESDRERRASHSVKRARPPPARAGETRLAETAVQRAGTSGRAPATPGTGRRRGLVAGAIALLALLALAAWGASGFFRSAGGPPPARVRAIPASDRSAAQQGYVDQLDQALAELRAGRADDAMTAVERALHSPGSDPEALFVRAQVFRAKGDDDSALGDYRDALAADPTYADAGLGIFWIQFERGDLEAAAKSVERIQAIEPDSAETLAAQGALAQRRGDREAAKALLARAIERDPSSALAQLWLGRVRLDEGDADGAISALVEAKRNDSRSARALAWLGEAYLAKGRHDEADARLAEAVALDPLDVEVHALRAALFLDRERNREAADFLAEVVQRHPRSARLWVLRGIALEASGDVDGAIEALGKGLALDGEDVEARLLLGVLHHRKGRLNEAIEQYRLVIETVGDMPQANLDLGLALFAQGDHAQARERLERVLDFDADDAAAHFHLGLLYMDYLADPARAAGHFRRYLDLGGDDPRVRGWLERL